MNLTAMSTVFRAGSVTYSVSIRYLPLSAVAVTVHAIPAESGFASTV